MSPGLRALAEAVGGGGGDLVNTVIIGGLIQLSKYNRCGFDSVTFYSPKTHLWNALITKILRVY